MKFGNARIANLKETEERIVNNGKRISRAILGNVNWEINTGEKIDSKAFFSCGIIELQKNGEISAHSHKNREEIYYIIDGTGDLIMNEERVKLTPGTAVWFPANTEHRVINNNIEPLVVYFSTATIKPGYMAHD